MLRTTLQVGDKGAVSVATPAGKLKGSMAHMDPAELVKHLDVSIDLQPLHEYSVVPPVREQADAWRQELKAALPVLSALCLCSV